MHEFLRMIFSELGSSIWLAMILAALIGGGIWWYQRRRGGEIRWKRLILILLLIGYLAVLGYATTFRGGIGFGGVNFRLFLAWKEAWNNFSVRNWANVLLNILLFVPLGILVPLVFPKCRGSRIILVVFGTTLFVECLQLITGSGVCDVDDLFANALGGLMGYCLLMAVLSAAGKKWGRGLVFFLLAMIPLVAVGGIFAAYRIQPYGNFPDGYLYRIDTSGVEWNWNCDLPEHQETAAVYRADSMTPAECDAYAEAFASIWGGTYDDVMYYDTDIYYRDYDTNGRMYYLTVTLGNGAVTLWTKENTAELDFETVWAELDRSELEAVLAEYGITIPAEAEYLGMTEPYGSDYQYLTYQADKIVTENGLLDGVCYVQLSEDGTDLHVEQNLISYAYYGEEAIISPEEACRMLYDGYFGGLWFEYRDPDQVSILSCSLGYELDTKGFYQPVYRFEVINPDWAFSDFIVIPAIK